MKRKNILSFVLFIAIISTQSFIVFAKELEKSNLNGNIKIEESKNKIHNQSNPHDVDKASVKENHKVKPSDNNHNFSSKSNKKIAKNTGWKLINEKWYFFKNDGSKATGWLDINGTKYYLDYSGILLTGWQLINNKWHFLNTDGSMAKGWLNINNTWYYLNSNGVMLTDWQLIDGYMYFLNSDGSMAKGWIKRNNTWYYLNSTGTMLTGWQLIDGYWYFLNADGSMHTGWLNINNTKYYLNPTGAMMTGWQLINNKWHFLNTDGSMHTGWLDINGYWYFLNTDGIMNTKWLDINGTKYYFNNNGVMLTSWQSINNNWHFFYNDGSMANQWLNINGTKYYFNKGNMLTGFNQINNNKYYFYPSGEMAYGISTKINGNKYYISDDGKIASDIWTGTTYVNTNGIMFEYNKSSCNSTTQYNLFKYMLYKDNQESVHRRAIELHGGITSNNCVFFTSEGLRRVGVRVPSSIGYTAFLENQLKKFGWEKSTDLKNLKPGDIVFSGLVHVYIFMGWADDGYAYIVDNQKSVFGQTFHKRQIFKYDPTTETNPATHFYYLH